MPEGHAGSGSPLVLTEGFLGGGFDFCGLAQAAVGAAVGAAVAVIVDAAIGFARAEPDNRPPTPPRTIEPELSVGPDRVSFGLAGSF